jgi:hypothetical protein
MKSKHGFIFIYGIFSFPLIFMMISYLKNFINKSNCLSENFDEKLKCLNFNSLPCISIIVLPLCLLKINNSWFQLNEFMISFSQKMISASQIHDFIFTSSTSQIHVFNSWIHDYDLMNSWSWNCEFMKLKLWNSWSWNDEFVKLKWWIREVEIVN